MTYFKILVLILIWYFESKFLKIKALVKAFCKFIKTFLVSEVRKSASSKLIFAKSDFLDLAKFVFLNLAKFNFLNLTKFALINRFLIFLSIPLSTIPLPLVREEAREKEVDWEQKNNQAREDLLR